MKAFRLTAPGVAGVATVPQPEPGPGEVLVRVGAAGACHSDLHLIETPPAGGATLPMTLGHEVSGWVEALGPGVRGWELGEPVAVYGISGCGHCPACLRGHDNACRVGPLSGIGLTHDGGMAEYLRVGAGQLFRIGDLDVAQAAPLTDAALTPYHAIQLSRDLLRPGATCVLIGVGGLGHMAVQILAATTAVRIIAVDVKPGALELAARMGATHTVQSGADAARHIRELVGPAPGGADVVFDFVGATSTMELGAAVVAVGGQLTLVGLAAGSLTVSPTAKGQALSGIPLETRLVIPFWGTRPELLDVIELARAGHITTQIDTVALDQANDAYDRMRAGKLQGRLVVMPRHRSTGQ